MTKFERGPARRVTATYDNFIVGTIDADFPAKPLFPDSRKVLEVMIQSGLSSTHTLRVGNRFGQPWEITPGNNITIPVCDLNLVSIATAEGGAAVVNWIAMI